MPNRILRDWTDSFVIDELDAHAERFFVRLIMKVDDYGCFYAEPRLLKANLFPLKPDTRESDISRWITACEKSGLIVVYSIANKQFLQINNFRQTLRQKTNKFPLPDGNSTKCIADATQMHSTCTSIANTKRKETEVETEVEKKGGSVFSNSENQLTYEEYQTQKPKFNFGTEHLMQNWEQWKSYLAAETGRTFQTFFAEEASMNDLTKMSGKSEDTAIAIIQQSIAKHWKSLYPLKTQDNQSQSDQNHESERKLSTDELRRKKAIDRFNQSLGKDTPQ